MHYEITAVWGTPLSFARWLTVNLLLALVPVLLGWLAGRLGHQAQQGARGRWLFLVPVLIVWLAFLPNTCYLLTDLRHFMLSVDRDNLWVGARAANPQARSGLIFWMAVASVDLMAGCLTFALAVYPVKRLFRSINPRLILLEPFFFWLIALGLYLGVVTRSNSWELFTEPRDVLSDAFTALARPYRAAALVLGGLALWFGYEVLETLLEGASLRWQRWRERRSPGRSAFRTEREPDRKSEDAKVSGGSDEAEAVTRL